MKDKPLPAGFAGKCPRCREGHMLVADGVVSWSGRERKWEFMGNPRNLRCLSCGYGYVLNPKREGKKEKT